MSTADFQNYDSKINKPTETIILLYFSIKPTGQNILQTYTFAVMLGYIYQGNEGGDVIQNCKCALKLPLCSKSSFENMNDRLNWLQILIKPVSEKSEAS